VEEMVFGGFERGGTKEGKLGGAPGAIQKISIVPHNKYGNYFKFLVILIFDSGKEEAHQTPTRQIYASETIWS